MNQNQQKEAVAKAALDYLLPKITRDTVLGIGTGSTTNYFIDALAAHKNAFEGTVASSKATAERLQARGIPLFDLNTQNSLSFYIDGTDECDHNLNLIKGGGGALTREKILANASKCFICIADSTKHVKILGRFPLPVEVIPMARSYVAREIIKLKGTPVYRDGVITDNGNVIIDIQGIDIVDPRALEEQINQIAGIVSSGLFSLRKPDLLFLSKDDGVSTIKST